MQEELQALKPNRSLIKEGLISPQNIQEGAIGSMITTAWMPGLINLTRQLKN